MPLVEHLRELRNRLFKSIIAIILGMVAAWIFYDQIYDFLSRPYVEGVKPLLEDKGLKASLTINGVTGAFTFQLKTALVGGLVLSSPVWFYQMWAFVLPALHRNERKWALILSGLGAPLFVGGVALGYFVLPKGVEVMLSFTPDSVQALVTLGGYLDFVLRTLLVFGISAEIPLVVVMLNRLGIVSAKQLAAFRPWTILGIFVFAAVATPTTDPLSMLLLAAPMTILYGISEIIAKITDRRRKVHAGPEVPDDEASPLDVERNPDDDIPSSL